MAGTNNLAYRYAQENYRQSAAAPYPAGTPRYSPNIRMKKAPHKAPRPKTKLKPKWKPIISILFIAAAAFVVLFRGVMVTDLCNTVEEKQKLLADTVAANQKTQLEIDSALDLKKVEEIATTELGMQRPEKYQTVYVSLNQGDYVETTKDGNTSGNNSEQEAQNSENGGFFKALLAYLH